MTESGPATGGDRRAGGTGDGRAGAGKATARAARARLRRPRPVRPEEDDQPGPGGKTSDGPDAGHTADPTDAPGTTDGADARRAAHPAAHPGRRRGRLRALRGAGAPEPAASAASPPSGPASAPAAPTATTATTAASAPAASAPATAAGGATAGHAPGNAPGNAPGGGTPGSTGGALAATTAGDGDGGPGDDDASPVSRFGKPGQPLRRTSPFYIGFVGGLGLLTAWFLARAFAGITDVLLLVVISFFLAAGLNPFVERLQRVGMPRRAAVVVVALGFLLVIAGFVTAIAQPLAEQTSQLVNSIPDKLTELLHNEQFKRLDEKYQIIDRAKEAAANANTAQNVAGGLLGFGKLVLDSVFDTLTVLVLTLYFLGSLPNIKENIYRLFPRSRRDRVRPLGDEIINGIGGYVNGMLIVATCAGLSSFVFLSVIELEYALPLALVVALTDLIPMIGATIGAVVVSAVAFFDSPGKALVCVIFYVAYQQFENYVIYPRVMKRAVNVPPALTVIAALVGAGLLGVTGALLAIPIAAAGLLITREVVIPRQDRS